MKYRCVSYPKFEPDHTWLRQVLLFVDEVHRIVPAGEKLHDSDDLKRLMDCCEGAVQRCPPEKYIEIPKAQAELFSNALNDQQFTDVVKDKKLIFEFHQDGQSELKGWEFLHRGKIGPVVDHVLRSKGMLKESPFDDMWRLVPRGVAGLVLSMVADQIALKRGFDAVTDQPLAFALNSLYGCAGKDSPQLEGIVASAVTSVQIPKAISLLSANDYAELRKRHEEVRPEFARMVRELKEDAGLNRITNPAEFRSRIDDITEHIDSQLQKFRNSKEAMKYNEWVPFLMASIIPVAATFMFGPIPGIVTAGFTFTVQAIGKATKKSEHFRYPKVLQTLCAAKDLAWQKEIEQIGRN